jgi:hypothetical protein
MRDRQPSFRSLMLGLIGLMISVQAASFCLDFFLDMRAATGRISRLWFVFGLQLTERVCSQGGFSQTCPEHAEPPIDADSPVKVENKSLRLLADRDSILTCGSAEISSPFRRY